MRAAQVVALDGPAGVRVTDVGAAPDGAPDEVLVDVHAVGVGYPDLLMSHGRYQIQPDLPYVLGVDFAGTVRAGGGSDFRVGDRVAGWSTYGSAAEVVSVPTDRVFPLPDGVSFVQGASMPLNYLTAHLAVVHRSGLGEGETLLVTGAAGGVGSAAVRIATALGIRVIAVVSTEAEAGYATAAGADQVLTELTPDRVHELTADRGVQGVLDVVGSEQVVLAALRSLATGGRLLSLGYVAGEIPAVRLNRLLLGNLDVCGVAWGPWTRANPGFAQQQWRELAALVDQGRLLPADPTVLALEEAAEALTALAERRSLGKTVLRLRDGAA